MNEMASQLSLCLLLLSAWAGAVVLAESPLQVFQLCETPEGVKGQCRSTSRVHVEPSDVTARAALELPIDMGLPCQDATKACAENVDVAEAPIKTPAGDAVSSCSVTLMPWSPFPCTYNTETYKGVEGQNKTNWCYSKQARPQEPGYEYAQDLQTDGYSNIYHGSMPDTPCGSSSSRGSETSSSSSSSSNTSSSSGSMTSGRQAAAAGPGYGRHFAKVTLTVSFRVAAGRQFDRTYWFQIGKAVVALGTCTEPTRWLGTDKWWSTTVDITHLQAYLAPGQLTRMSLSNLLSNTYNVPLWAEARIQYYWHEQQPQQQHAADDSVQSDPVVPPVIERPAGSMAAAPVAGAALPPAAAAATVAATADVPYEVIPLTPDADAEVSTAVLMGTGDSPKAWPSITFNLPPMLSEPGNIYRAQLLVTPKADACEEFWAMNPSGRGTNNTCGGISTGEPYREVRVYVNDQLAGFTPIYYTMYTGGVDPRLWSAIVASYTYSLPTYTFDLSPWLPQLNAKPRPSDPSTQQPTTTASSSGSSSSRADSSSGADRSDSRLPDILQKPLPSRRLTQEVGQPQQQPGQQPHDQQPDKQQSRDQRQASAAPPGSRSRASHSITVELAGATGNGWLVSNTLLLWRAVDAAGAPEVLTGQQEVQVELSQGFDQPMSSACSALDADVSVAGNCSLEVQDRSLEASSVLQWKGRRWDARVRYATSKYKNVVTYNNGANVTDGALSWNQATQHEATWSVTKQLPAAHAAATPNIGVDGAEQQQGQQATDSSNQQQQQQQESHHADADAGRQDQKHRQQQHEEQQGPALPGTGVRGSPLCDVLTLSSVSYDWLNTGVVAAGGLFEYSFNSTQLLPTVYTPGSLTARQAADGLLRDGSSSEGHTYGSTCSASQVLSRAQQHYQRATMLNVYTPQSPQCVVPDNATHTVSLVNSVSSRAGLSGVFTARDAGAVVGGSLRSLQAAEENSCVQRLGTCGFCGAYLMSNKVEWYC